MTYSVSIIPPFYTPPFSSVNAIYSSSLSLCSPLQLPHPISASSRGRRKPITMSSVGSRFVGLEAKRRRPFAARKEMVIQEIKEEEEEEGPPPSEESENNSKPRRIALFVEPSPFAWVHCEIIFNHIDVRKIGFTVFSLFLYWSRTHWAHPSWGIRLRWCWWHIGNGIMLVFSWNIDGFWFSL